MCVIHHAIWQQLAGFFGAAESAGNDLPIRRERRCRNGRLLDRKAAVGHANGAQRLEQTECDCNLVRARPDDDLLNNIGNEFYLPAPAIRRSRSTGCGAPSMSRTDGVIRREGLGGSSSCPLTCHSASSLKPECFQKVSKSASHAKSSPSTRAGLRARSSEACVCVAASTYAHRYPPRRCLQSRAGYSKRWKTRPIVCQYCRYTVSAISTALACRSLRYCVRCFPRLVPPLASGIQATRERAGGRPRTPIEIGGKSSAD